jgi:hypothetical protein
LRDEWSRGGDTHYNSGVSYLPATAATIELKVAFLSGVTVEEGSPSDTV